jgi:hypothetical protein
MICGDVRYIVLCMVAVGMALGAMIAIGHRGDNRAIRVSREMAHLSGCIQSYYNHTDTLPGDSLASIVRGLICAPFGNFFERLKEDCPMILLDRDPWGTGFVVVIDDRETKYLFTVRSCGPNRVDDGGQNDDVQYELAISKVEL